MEEQEINSSVFYAKLPILLLWSEYSKTLKSNNKSSAKRKLSGSHIWQNPSKQANNFVGIEAAIKVYWNAYFCLPSANCQNNSFELRKRKLCQLRANCGAFTCNWLLAPLIGAANEYTLVWRCDKLVDLPLTIGSSHSSSFMKFRWKPSSQRIFILLS